MLHFVQINHILYVLYVFMLTYIQGMLSTLNTVIVSTFNSTIMSDGILQNFSHFKLCSGEGNINLHETMKYKNKHQLLGIKKKIFKHFWKIIYRKEIVRLNNGYFGHMLNNWSIFDQFHSLFTQNYSQSITHTGMHTLTVCVH